MLQNMQCKEIIFEFLHHLVHLSVLFSWVYLSVRVAINIDFSKKKLSVIDNLISPSLAPTFLLFFKTTEWLSGLKTLKYTRPY